MLISKLKFGVAMILFASVLVTGLAAWASHEAGNSPGPSPGSIDTAPRVVKPRLTPPRSEPTGLVKRVVHGIVRDEHGSPVADAWVGDYLTPTGPLGVGLQKDRMRMIPLNFRDKATARTDSKGQFTVEVNFSLPRFRQTEIHCASPDLLREAIQVVRADGPDRLFDITLTIRLESLA
jgi:hypothetical protein